MRLFFIKKVRIWFALQANLRFGLLFSLKHRMLSIKHRSSGNYYLCRRTSVPGTIFPIDHTQRTFNSLSRITISASNPLANAPFRSLTPIKRAGVSEAMRRLLVWRWVGILPLWFRQYKSYFWSTSRIWLRFSGCQLVYKFCRIWWCKQWRQQSLCLLCFRHCSFQIGRFGLDSRDRRHSVGQWFL